MSGDELERLLRSTPARLGVGRAGARPRTASALEFRADHARARDAVQSVWSEPFLAELRARGCLFVRSAAPDRAAYLRRPDLGRSLAPGEAARIAAARVPGAVAQIVVTDGLSARAAETQLARVWPMLVRGLERLGPLAAPVAVTLGRVAIADRVCEASGARLAVQLIGERPGLGTAESLGCYVTLRPHAATTDADRKCISNIHARGLAPDEAGAAIVELCERILRAGSSGTQVEL
ncbi:MAG TPA: ethanolamine ammonia-lyase subunit EutC [Myxococcota bacterium]|jgi:ethanolamine ammonia-lyase small subunit